MVWNTILAFGKEFLWNKLSINILHSFLSHAKPSPQCITTRFNCQEECDKIWTCIFAWFVFLFWEAMIMWQPRLAHTASSCCHPSCGHPSPHTFCTLLHPFHTHVPTHHANPQPLPPTFHTQQLCLVNAITMVQEVCSGIFSLLYFMICKIWQKKKIKSAFWAAVHINW